jgi:hypothetical protein
MKREEHAATGILVTGFPLAMSGSIAYLFSAVSSVFAACAFLNGSENGSMQHDGSKRQ